MPDLFADFGGLLEKHLFLGRTLLLWLQGYQTCAGAGMLVPGLANAVLVQNLVLGGCFPHLFLHFGGLLEKHLFLGRTLLLRLQGYQTCGGAGMLVPGLANAALAHHLVLGCFPDLSGPICRFRWPTRKAFVLRTDAAFAAPGLPNLCWCRNAGSRASKRCAGAAFCAQDFFLAISVAYWKSICSEDGHCFCGSRATKPVLVQECWLQG